jgi:hypothetical protein
MFVHLFPKNCSWACIVAGLAYLPYWLGESEFVSIPFVLPIYTTDTYLWK